MPEGHTIHRLARDHRRDLVGRSFRTSSPQGRFADGARELDRRRLKAVEAIGKHLFYDWSGRRCLHVHLGLYGKFRPFEGPAPDPRGAVRLRVEGSGRGFDLNGPSRCELLNPAERQAILDRLGPDPLRSDADPARAAGRVSGSRAAIGALLLDQSVIAGVGNIFRSEALFAVRIHPRRPGRELTRAEFSRLWRTLVGMLRVGVEHDRIITVGWQRAGKASARRPREERLAIYEQTECPRCGGEIERMELAARKIFACATCQE